MTFWLLEKGYMEPVEQGKPFAWVVGLYFFFLFAGNFNYRSAWSDLVTERAARFNKECMNGLRSS